MIAHARRAGALVLFAGVSSVAATPRDASVEPVAIPVRFAEGDSRVSLELHTSSDASPVQGELTHVVMADGVVESRMVFHLPNSVFEETATFTQAGVFELRSFHLVQGGSAFPADIDATLDHSGAYRIKSTSHTDGRVETFEGTIALPRDTYNGMVVTIAKNLQDGAPHRVHVVAFTPVPRIVALDLAPAGRDRVVLGEREATAMHVVIKPRLNALLRILAKLKGVTPQDSHVWIVNDRVPEFVGFEGPMYTGPVWRVNLSSSGWPQPIVSREPLP